MRRTAGRRLADLPQVRSAITLLDAGGDHVKVVLMSTTTIGLQPHELAATEGFAVRDVKGRVLGDVECPMYGRVADEPDAVAVRGGLLGRRHYIVPTAAIGRIDRPQREIALSVGAGALVRFL